LFNIARNRYCVNAKNAFAKLFIFFKHFVKKDLPNKNLCGNIPNVLKINIDLTYKLL